MSDDEKLEQRLDNLAAFHVGLFMGAATRIDDSVATIRHALWLLIQEAERHRALSHE